MKKRNLKVLSAVLTASMALTMGGCGNGSSDTTPTPAPTTGATSGNETTPEPTKAADTGDTGSDTTTPTPNAGTETPGNTDTPKEITTIRFGTHYEQELNPHYVDDVTGEYTMAEADREARFAAEQAILDEYGVVFEYVQYAGNTTEVLLQSVMANDPICDIAWMWGGSEGTVLAQNVLQQLDDYAYIFDDPEYSWMLYDKVFGHNYFLGAVMRFNQRWPLVYNISYIEAVDSLKDADGNTIYPNQLYEEGKWTWSTFKDYLAKIEAFYANSSAPNRPERRIDSYQTDYRFAALSALYANGGAIYGDSGLMANSEASKEAVAYIQDLMDNKLLTCETYDNSITPGWTWNGSNFQGGETVFTDIPDWYIGGAASEASKRGESIGIVPWPRPDDVAVDDPSYQQVLTVSDSIGILKGVSPEKTELALKALALYYKTYFTTSAGVETMAEYKDEFAAQQAANYGFDIFHEEVGDAMLRTYQQTAAKLTGNDLSDLIGMRVKWDEILGNSLYGANGTASYDVAIEANLNVFNTVVDDMTAILSSEGVHDNVNPAVNTASSDPLAIPAGTTFENVAWGDYITATDNADGTFDISAMEVEWNTEVDFGVVGTYSNAFKAKFTDSTGNTGEKEISFVIYDAANTIAPTVTLVAEPAAVAMDTSTADIAWKGSFIESATDANGLDVSRNIKADLSSLDTTTPGTYAVTITVTDFAGNATEVTVNVTVE